MTTKLKATPDWLRVGIRERPEAVDREKGIVYGAIGAEEMTFKDRRGEFDRAAIREVVKLSKAGPKGLKARLGHPSMSGDSLGKFLGRFRNGRSAAILRPAGDGKMVERLAAKFDLHLDPSSFDTPNGNLGKYILDLAESDSDAFGASLVLQIDEEFRLDKKGVRLKDDDGNDLPPLWRPKVLHALDVVDEGDATESFLSAGLTADGLPDEVVRKATQLLEQQLGGQPRDVVRARVVAYLDRYLDYKYGGDAPEADEVLDAAPAGMPIDTLRRKLAING
jgi:hypothetical protein